MALRLLGVFAVASLASTPLVGQGVDHVAAADLRAATARSELSKSRGGAPFYSKDGNAIYLFNRRELASEIELHCGWDDLFWVQSGAGDIRTSERVAEPTLVAESEWRAKKLLSPKSVFVSVGDFVRVPAGVAHEIVPTGDAPLVYLVVKVRSSRAKACSGRRANSK